MEEGAVLFTVITGAGTRRCGQSEHSTRSELNQWEARMITAQDEKAWQVWPRSRACEDTSEHQWSWTLLTWEWSHDHSPRSWGHDTIWPGRRQCEQCSDYQWQRSTRPGHCPPQCCQPWWVVRTLLSSWSHSHSPLSPVSSHLPWSPWLCLPPEHCQRSPAPDTPGHHSLEHHDRWGERVSEWCHCQPRYSAWWTSSPPPALCPWTSTPRSTPHCPPSPDSGHCPPPWPGTCWPGDQTPAAPCSPRWSSPCVCQFQQILK